MFYFDVDNMLTLKLCSAIIICLFYMFLIGVLQTFLKIPIFINDYQKVHANFDFKLLRLITVSTVSTVYETSYINFWPSIFLVKSNISTGKFDIFQHNRTQNVLMYDRHLCCLPKHQTKAPLDMFLLPFDASVDVNKIYEIKYIFNSVLKIEPIKRTFLLSQCRICQGFDHTQNYCNKPSGCVKCAEIPRRCSRLVTPKR